MARLEIEIGAVNDELKKILQDSKIALNNFAKEVNGSKGALSGLSQSSADTRRAIDAQRVAQERAKTATMQARQASAELTLANRQNKGAVDAAAGSYREAQQRLTALGRSIREAKGGFDSTNPAIKAQISEYRKLNEQLKSFDAKMGNHYRNVGNYGSALSSVVPQLSQFASKGGGLLAVALAAKDAYNSVSKFDSGMKNVEKTTGLSRGEVAKLGDEFVELSKNLKTVSANSLTQYATVAGQLGVKGTKNILSFTEALAKLETATNISGEEGGSEIARTLTLIDGGVQNVKAFGDEIVNLGNNFAATEKEILSNAESIAQNVGIYRIGRQDVLAYATATKAVGIEAELVGSTFNRTLAIFEAAIRTGDGLKSILSLVGGTQAELSRRFKSDASGVFMDFIGSLNKIYKSGGSVNEQLEKVGVNAVRDQRVIQSLAANGFDVLTQAMEASRNSAGALDAEFETASGKMTNQMNRVRVSVENLWISMEQGTGVIGNVSVAFADATANIIDGFTNIVTSGSFKEFFARMGELSSTSAIRVSSKMFGDALKNIDGAQSGRSRGLVSYGEMKSFRDMSESDKKRMLSAQEQLVQEQIKEYNLNKQNLKIRESMLWNAEKMAKMRSILGKNDSSVIPGAGNKTSDLPIATDKSKSAKTRRSVKSIDDILPSLQGNDGNYYDQQLAKINSEYSKLVKTIRESVGSQYKISQALGLAAAKKDFDTLKVSVDRFIDSTKGLKTKSGGTSLTGSLADPTQFSPSEWERLRLGGRNYTTKKEDKEQEDKFSKIIERSLRGGINDILDDIGDLGSNFYEVFSNVFTKLTKPFQNIFSGILSQQLSGLVSGNMDNAQLFGMSNDKTKALVAGVGALGGIVSGVFKKDTGAQVIGGALSGGAAGFSVGGPWGAAVGAVVGALGGLFSAKASKRQEKLQEAQLEEQKKQTALQQRMAALTFSSSIVGQMTNQGIVTEVSRNEFGDITFRVEGRDLVASYNREKDAQSRGL